MPAALCIDAGVIEPTSLRIRNLALNKKGACRFVHFTDFHFKGDVNYAAEMVESINDLAPQFVCFTGDLVEDKAFAAAALAFITQIKAPVYGVPGNHDFWSRAPFADYERAFAKTGGAWLVDRTVVLDQHGIEIVGMGRGGLRACGPARLPRQILLVHYPCTADQLEGRRFELILAGHSHGGQVRLPFYGPVILPWGVGRYDLGFFETAGGPLYVNPGIGFYEIPVRFNCRPELTVVTI